ncbi:hypothetical protein GCM10011609_88470 [Lentzea pudingi]|uniref:Beta-ketoacyl synthase C-terminal domain-containing protein n=1 Tax=Lentzea pudingi TaxID=1789439 RepID=A0ABQ2IX91_9PSEU|nr:hypothetical protein GCM10011609_88470 [Lentzea pudingi]
MPVSSTKGTTGHLLKAAGVVEFVITLLALTDGVLPPTANFTGPPSGNVRSRCRRGIVKNCSG